MNANPNKYIQLKGDLISLETPIIMGILNVTPDSFFAASRQTTEADIDARLAAIAGEGGRIVDIGGCSSRPGGTDISEEEEIKRLEPALRLAQHYPELAVSVDTFRAGIARRAVEEFGAAMINDISGGDLDRDMFGTVASLGAAYVLMHGRGTSVTVQHSIVGGDLIVEIRKQMAERVYRLEQAGVNDIIIDPGFGFGKTTEQNYELMAHLDCFQIFEMPVLVGISRKSMVYKPSGTGPEDSLSGTTALHTLALLNGADILRVHDVREASEAIRIVKSYKNYKNNKTQESHVDTIRNQRSH
ncbi:MAG: dihydropteroate synthase [Tannerellaceae bacterium]|jgi:dihydropteroate synthase|nr:dihydropteroate synthase [Tannerellaceae bacterium]